MEENKKEKILVRINKIKYLLESIFEPNSWRIVSRYSTIIQIKDLLCEIEQEMENE